MPTTARSTPLHSRRVAYVIDDSDAKAVLGDAGDDVLIRIGADVRAYRARFRLPVVRRRYPTARRCSTRPGQPADPRPFAGRCPRTATARGRKVLEYTLTHRYGMTESSVYLSPAPLYRTAGVNYTMAVRRVGATAITMPKFDAETVLRLIETHRVTHAQFIVRPCSSEC